MKKACFFCMAVCLLMLAVSGVGLAAETIRVGVTPVPHRQIMTIAGKLLEKEGYALELVNFSDYVQPNIAVMERQLDANFFQHIPYFEHMNSVRNMRLAWVAKVHIEPMGLYSKKITSLDELKKGDLIGLPSDPTNRARALRLLEANGLVSVKPGELITSRDVLENPRGLTFRELDAAQLPRTLVDVAASVINTNFAAQAGLAPSKDAIIIEGKESPYANVVVVRDEDAEKPWVKALVKAVNSPEVKAYIVKELEPKGIVPAF